MGGFGLRDCSGEIFFFFFGDGIGNMDGGLGGWKDICTYLTLPEEGLQFIRF